MMKNRKLILGILVLVIIGTVIISDYLQEKGEGIQPIPESILKSRFSYMVNEDWQLLQESREINNYLSWERASHANWQEIEPRKGEYHWEKIDRYVETAQEKDIQILFTVWPFTDWDQETCNMHLEWDPNEFPEEFINIKDPRSWDLRFCAHRKGKPCDMEAYQEFLRLLVERYNGDGQEDMPGLRYPVRYWEIGNEVDVGGFFQGSDEDYFEILKASYITIKDTDPNATVLIAAVPSLLSYALPGWEIPEWARPGLNPVELFELGAANYFDIMNSHSFGQSKEVREFLKRYGAGDKPIWITEPSGFCPGCVERAEEENISLATLYKEAFEEEFQYGVERISIPPVLDSQALREAVRAVEKSK